MKTKCVGGSVVNAVQMASLMINTFNTYFQSNKTSCLKLIRIVLFDEQTTNQFKTVFQKETANMEKGILFREKGCRTISIIQYQIFSFAMIKKFT